MAFDQAIIRVGQPTVGGKVGRLRAGQQSLQTWLLGDLEAPAEGVSTQAIDRQRHQILALKAQQRRGIARQQRAQRLQQATITLSLGQITGQIGHQR